VFFSDNYRDTIDSFVIDYQSITKSIHGCGFNLM